MEVDEFKESKESMETSGKENAMCNGNGEHAESSTEKNDSMKKGEINNASQSSDSTELNDKFEKIETSTMEKTENNKQNKCNSEKCASKNNQDKEQDYKRSKNSQGDKDSDQGEDITESGAMEVVEQSKEDSGYDSKNPDTKNVSMENKEKSCSEKKDVEKSDEKADSTQAQRKTDTVTLNNSPKSDDKSALKGADVKEANKHSTVQKEVNSPGTNRANSASRTPTPTNKDLNTPTAQNIIKASETSTPSSSKSNSRSATPVVIGSTPTSSGGSVQGNTKEKEVISAKKTKVSRMLDQSGPSENFRPIAQLLIDIGMDITRQTVYKDLIRIQRKKESKGKLDGKEKSQLEKLGTAHAELVSKNQSFINEMKSCQHCGFKSECENVMTCHMEYAHDQEIGFFTCVLCKDSKETLASFSSAAQFLYHMEAAHSRRGRIYLKHAFFVCPNCPYESNNINQFKKHTDKCTRIFSERSNLIPLAPDKDIPLFAPRPPTPKVPKMVAKAAAVRPAARPVVPKVPTRPVAPPRPAMPRTSTPVAPFTARMNSPMISVMSTRPTMPAQAIRPVAARPVIPTRPSTPARPPPSAASPSMPTPDGPNLVQMNGQWYKLALVGTQQFLVPVSDPSAARASKNSSPVVVQSGGQAMTSPVPSIRATRPPTPQRDYEVCEICGGFVRDKEALRIHFIWAHKVHIHKDVFKGHVPPLACGKCNDINVRFWTSIGLNKHRQEGHPVNPQLNLNNLPREKKLIDEIAKQCIYCLESFAATITAKGFWDHMGIHGISPASIFRTNKCCACGSRIKDVNAMNQHLRTKHSLLFAKGTFTKEAAKSPAVTKIVVPKPVSKPKDAAKDTASVVTCAHCTFSAPATLMNKHVSDLHPVKCARCSQRFNDLDSMRQHFNAKHSQERDECPICQTSVKIGRSFVRHMKSDHMKGCSVIIQRLAKTILAARRDEIEKILSEVQKTPNKRKRNTPQKVESSKEKVIVLDEDSPPRKKSRVPDNKKNADGKQILEVDGEEIVVEIQQDEDDEEEKEEKFSLKITSSESLANSADQHALVNGTHDEREENEIIITSSRSLANNATGRNTPEQGKDDSGAKKKPESICIDDSDDVNESREENGDVEMEVN